MPALAKIDPPERPLPPLRLIRTIIRNPIEAWPKPVYEQPVFRSRAFGCETVFITEPDLVQQVLVEKADAFVKAHIYVETTGHAQAWHRHADAR